MLRNELGVVSKVAVTLINGDCVTSVTVQVEICLRFRWRKYF